MNRSAWLLGTAAALVCGATASDAQMLHDPGVLPSRRALERVGLERGWHGAVPLQTGLEQVIELSVADGMLFAQTSMAQLHAFDAETGELLWSADMGPKTGKAAGVSVNDNRVFATNANALYAFDRETGRFVWFQRLESPAASATAADDELALVGLQSGKLVAYSLVEREVEWMRPAAGPPGGFKFAIQTNGPILANPVLTQFVLAVASTDGKLYVAKLDPMSILHRSQSLGSIRASMGVYGRGEESYLMVPSTDGNLYSINLFTGEQRWVFPTSQPINAQPLVAGGEIPRTRIELRERQVERTGSDLRTYTETVVEPVRTTETVSMPPTVYVLNQAGRLFAIDPETGQARWGVAGTETGANQILAIGAERVYLRSEYGDLGIVDRETGQVISTPVETFQRAGLDLRVFNSAPTNDDNDRIYLASRFGTIVCLRRLGAQFPLPLRDPTERAFGQLREVPGADVQTPPSPPPAGEEDFDFGFDGGF